MDRLNEFAAGHLGFCLAEMLAEIDDQLSRHTAARALDQLDARQAAGQPIEAVCASNLRARLVEKLASDPLVLARRKLVEVNTILTSGTAPGGASSSNVTDLARVRQQRRSAANPATSADRPRLMAFPGRGVAVMALCALATLSSLGWVARTPGIDILTAIAPPHGPVPAAQVGIADAH